MPNTRRFQQLPRTPVSEAGSSPASTPASGQGSSGLVRGSSRFTEETDKLLAIYLRLGDEGDDDEELDGSLKTTLRNAVINHVVPHVKFLSADMTNIVRGNSERRNLMSSFPSFWMPDFSDPSEDGKLAHVIVGRCGYQRMPAEEKARFWMKIRGKINPIINNYRSNTANALKRNVVQGLKLSDADGIDEPIPDNPPDGTQAEIDSWFCKKHASALSRMLSYVDGDIAELYQDEEAFAAFVHFALSTTIKKSAWRLGRNKKLVSLLFTKYDEALALLILENNCDGIKEIAEGGGGEGRKTIKTKYTCKGFKESNKGGRGWTEEGMLRFCDLEAIVDRSRNHGRREGMERRIKEAYVVKRKNSREEESDEDDEDEGRVRGRMPRERIIVCTGIPI